MGRALPFGGIEDLTATGSATAEAYFERLSQALFAAVENAGISNGARAIDKIDTDALELAEIVAETALRSAMLGALDADFEAAEDTTVQIEKFETRGQRVPWVKKPFVEAMKDFEERQVVTPRAFQRMRDAARVRAFTVAGASRKKVIAVVKEQLSKALADGEDLLTFKKNLNEKLELKGWLKPGPRAEVPTRPGSPWHVETIFRNGVQASYARGRQRQMLQPAVLAARPFWECVTAADERVRASHKKMHGKTFAVSDPIWRTLGTPPWDHNCRCRVVSRSAKAVEKRGGADASADVDTDGVVGEDFSGQLIDLDEEQLNLPLPEPKRVADDAEPKRVPDTKPVVVVEPNGAERVRSVGGVANARFDTNSLRAKSIDQARDAFEYATPEEATQIALGEAPVVTSIQPPPGASPERVEKFRKKFEFLQPVTVEIRPGGIVELADGRHRVIAASEAGATDIMAKVRVLDAEGNTISEELGPIALGKRADAVDLSDLGLLKSRPKHRVAVKGVHFERHNVSLSGSSSRPKRPLAAKDAIESVDSDTRLVLEKRPLRVIQTKRDARRGANKVSGTYWHRLRTIELNEGSARKLGRDVSSLGHGAWGVSSTAKTLQEAERLTMTHEIGHHAHRSLNDLPGGQSLFNEIGQEYARRRDAIRDWRRTGGPNRRQKTSPAISEYAMTNEFEYFAESWTAFQHAPEQLRAVDPIGHELVGKVIRFYQAQP
jgi:SPP1 gp7 family putative phage head morphogenesis protein